MNELDEMAKILYDRPGTGDLACGKGQYRERELLSRSHMQTLVV